MVLIKSENKKHYLENSCGIHKSRTKVSKETNYFPFGVCFGKEFNDFAVDYKEQ